MGYKEQLINTVKDIKPELVKYIELDDDETVEKKWVRFKKIREEIENKKYRKEKIFLLYTAMDKWNLEETEYFLSCSDEKCTEFWNEAVALASSVAFEKLFRNYQKNYYSDSNIHELENDIRVLGYAKDKLSETYSSNERKIILDNALHSTGIYDFYETLKKNEENISPKKQKIRPVLFIAIVAAVIWFLILEGIIK